jgi:hypothetical protein
MTLQTTQNSDWFVQAILTDGNVEKCLNQVIGDLQSKEKFVLKLKLKLGEKTDLAPDKLSDLSARVKILENTIKFRVGILSYERRAPWFRSCAVTATGPFSGSVLPDPIFAPYDESLTPQIRSGLMECWIRKNLLNYPLKATESCIWKILLVLNSEWWNLGDLQDWPRLERLPDELPQNLESRSLRAFLLNVKSEYLNVHERLKSCYQMLFDASVPFWDAAPLARRTRASEGSEDQSYRVAENMRAEFKRRRANTPTLKRPTVKTGQDLEALRFMGFDDFPDQELLKQRYHVLAREMHPDRDGGNESKFKMLSKCYKHLSKFCTL